MENGRIFCYKQTDRNGRGVAGDTCTWNELPERVLTNNPVIAGKSMESLEKCLSDKTTAGSNENVQGRICAKCATAKCAKHDH